MACDGSPVRLPRLMEASDTEAWRLLDRTEYGHAVVTLHGFPAVRPAGHLLDHDSLVVRTALPPDLLTTAGDRPSPLAYHVHEIDPTSGNGWEVTVLGLAEPIADPRAEARYRVSLPGWTHGHYDTVLRLHPHTVTGFRLGHPLSLVPDACPVGVR
ncbi:pyridoxamine 5'-phosphate oxidase family protein [Yinghuangia sp. ASG 101]|uniref:pyridoxamine 5'-phosphate oxidase family protein n=1 Tax=Yinghuangia sp. ASG 101 TaxID=2896848 RepID=UPI001E30E6E5|nr:pyridoxamine 5'-phosphate oxidase family protein [Yinghuangia sp. ASG 101]UGQ11860.1 pyridoxamine 5'-phosphate oxidase family protein [Yinghuangia sp. ASG 101]